MRNRKFNAEFSTKKAWKIEDKGIISSGCCNNYHPRILCSHTLKNKDKKMILDIKSLR